MSLRTLGQKIKSKYPEYNDISDEEVGRRILSKYPEYTDIAAEPDMLEQIATLPKRTIPEKIAGFIGGEKLASGLGKTLFRLTKEGKDLDKLLEEGKITSDEYEAISTGGLSQEEVAGSAAHLALTAGTLGFAGKPAAAVTQKLAAKPVAAVGIRATEAIATQAAFNIASDLETRRKVHQDPTSLILAAVIPEVFRQTGNLIKSLEGSRLVDGLYNSAFGVSKTIRVAGKSPARFAATEKIIGTGARILERSNRETNVLESQIQKIVRASSKMINSKEIIDTVDDKLTQAFQGARGPDEVKAIIAKLPIRGLLEKEQLTLHEANILRRTLDNRYLRDSDFIKTALPETKRALRTVANTLRTAVKTAEPSTDSLFFNYSKWIRIHESLNAELNKPHALRNMIDWIITAAGATSGGLVGGVPGGIVGAVTFRGFMEATESVLAKTLTASSLETIGQLASQAGVKLGGISKPVKVILFKELAELD